MISYFLYIYYTLSNRIYTSNISEMTIKFLYEDYMGSI